MNRTSTSSRRRVAHRLLAVGLVGLTACEASTPIELDLDVAEPAERWIDGQDPIVPYLLEDEAWLEEAWRAVVPEDQLAFGC